MLPAQMSCRSPWGMATDWSPSPPLFLTKVHFSRDQSQCRHQYCSSLFPPLYTVGAQKLTGWFCPKSLFLGVWQQMHYRVLAGYLCRRMYAAWTHWMAFWSVIVKVATAGRGHEESWISYFEWELTHQVFLSALPNWYVCQRAKSHSIYMLI